MLTEISVQNVALIEEATLELSPGLNAITGETGAGKTLVATRSANPRALVPADLARRAEPYFEHVEAIDEPEAALERAHALAGPGGGVLVTGSLYLLADLKRPQDGRRASTL